MRDGVQLHGNQGIVNPNAEVIGVAECHKIVKDFEQMKHQGTKKAASEEPQTPEKPAEDPDTLPKEGDDSDGDDDLAIDMSGGSPDITFNTNKHPNTVQDDIHTPTSKTTSKDEFPNHLR